MEQTTDESYSDFGGIANFYGLQREQAALLLNNAQGEERSMTITKLLPGPGIFRCETKEGYDVWLFPEQNPNYLRLADLLAYSLGYKVSAKCLQSTSQPNAYFLLDIKLSS